MTFLLLFITFLALFGLGVLTGKFLSRLDKRVRVAYRQAFELAQTEWYFKEFKERNDGCVIFIFRNVEDCEKFLSLNVPDHLWLAKRLQLLHHLDRVKFGLSECQDPEMVEMPAGYLTVISIASWS